MPRYTDMALPIVIGLGLLSGCGPVESSSSSTTTETTETTETTGTTIETGETMDTTTSSELTTSMTTTTTTTTEVVDACPEDPTPEITTEDFAVFARADAPEAPGEGTREKPFTSLQAAIDAAAASDKRVFACSGAPFQESVVIDTPMELRGGFDCEQGWIYDPLLRSTVLGVADSVAMTVTKPASGSTVVGWQIEAPDAVSPGASSVALVVARLIKPTFLCRCDLIAGNGADGVDAETWAGAAPAPSGADAAQPGEPGAASDECTDPAVFHGGLNGVTQCDDDPTDGGLGGLGGIPPGGGGDGEDGAPAAEPFPPYGSGGQGAGSCGDGFIGAPGWQAANGKGGVKIGALSLTGVKNVDGTPGQHGNRGGGGGGGGGRGYATACGPQSLEGFGASGGGGGAGGCGGKPGGGGTAGGSSVGLVALGGDLFVKTATFTTGAGGDGGEGGIGQLGGNGGLGAPGGNPDGCSGGDGGDGTAGGRGGAGQGGDSVSLMRYGLLSDVVLEDCDYFYGPAGKGGGEIADIQLGLKGSDGVSSSIRIFPEP